MARDHFQDIIPPEEPRDRGEEGGGSEDAYDAAGDSQHSLTVASSDKSIRNINITRRATPADPGRVSPKRVQSRMWLWILAAICILVLVILAVLYVFRRTTVTVVPHQQPVVFDQTMEFTAYPVNGAGSSTLQYSTKETDLEATTPVTSSGTTHQETKATGTVTVVNNYSMSPVRLVKTTRFQSASGLVFRAPDEIVIPAKQGDNPGKVSVTVVADAAGAEYNIGPNQHLTLPGLQSNAAMFAGVYAITAASTTGGFAGEAPAVSDADLAAARSSLRSKLQQQAMGFAEAQSNEGIVLKPIITFTDEAPHAAAGASVQVGESAHIVLPIVAQDQLAMAVAQAVTADAASIQYTLSPGSNFAANATGDQVTTENGLLTFSMSGSAMLVARVDAPGLAQALAGRDATAFETIVANFPGIDSAHARIEPFWENTFPANPKDIHVVVSPPSK